MKLDKALIESLDKEKWNYQYDNDGAIYIDTIPEEIAPLYLGRIITAKGLQKTYRKRCIAIRNEMSDEYADLFEAFKIDYIEVFNVKSIAIMVKAIVVFCFCVLRNFFCGNLQKQQYKGVLIGDLIYDTIIRSKEPVYTLGRVLNFKQLKVVAKGILTAVYVEKQYKKIVPSYFIAADLIYNQAIPVRFAAKYGAKIIVICAGKESFVIPEKIIGRYYEIYWSDYQKEKMFSDMQKGASDDWKEVVEGVLNATYSGIGDWNTELAFAGENEKRDSVLKRLNIDNGKKNVVIMAHCMSDAPHCTKIIYRDYYDWLKQTIKIIRDIDDVNWIVKEHPSSFWYGEKGVVESLLKCYGSKNILLFPQNYSAEVVTNIADIIITVAGTAGTEMSCKGLRVIVAGSPFYAEESFAIKCDSVESYRRTLENIKEVEPLNADEIVEAKKVYYYSRSLFKDVDDNLQKIANKYYTTYTKDFVWNQHTLESFYGEIVNELNAVGLENTYWYSFGELIKIDSLV